MQASHQAAAPGWWWWVEEAAQTAQSSCCAKGLGFTGGGTLAGGGLVPIGIFLAGACSSKWAGGAFRAGGAGLASGAVISWPGGGALRTIGGGLTTCWNKAAAASIFFAGGIFKGGPEDDAVEAFAWRLASYAAQGLSPDPHAGNGPLPPPALGGTGPALADFQAPVGGGLAGGAVGAVGAGLAGGAVGRSGTGIWFSLANKAALRQSVSVAK